jgi:hypothetical protein
LGVVAEWSNQGETHTVNRITRFTVSSYPSVMTCDRSCRLAAYAPVCPTKFTVGASKSEESDCLQFAHDDVLREMEMVGPGPLPRAEEGEASSIEGFVGVGLTVSAEPWGSGDRSRFAVGWCNGRAFSS